MCKSIYSYTDVITLILVTDTLGLIWSGCCFLNQKGYLPEADLSLLEKQQLLSMIQALIRILPVNVMDGIFKLGKIQ